jgi:type IV pilus assembly protein PilY1
MKTRMKTIATLLLSVAGAAHAQGVSQTPLTVSNGVPGNMLLTPSVEFPTINSKANLGAFNTATTYTGYFDPFKCYTYVYNATESLRHFNPARSTGTTPATCSAASMEWSGNWLNWATTQTIDPFRKALTGGLRVRDTATETWLEKARHDGQGGLGYFPLATVSGTATVSSVMPNSNWGAVSTRVVGGGSELYFTSTRVCTAVDVIGAAALPVNSASQPVVEYNPATHVLNTSNTNSPVVYTDCDASAAVNNQPQTNANRIYRVSVRVKVCVTGMLEPNCVQYASGYKPDGLIQKYSRKIRFSVFGYLLDNGAYRDGGVLRANQKYV